MNPQIQEFYASPGPITKTGKYQDQIKKLPRDVGELNKMEMLQWDVWGAQPQPGQELTADELAFFDKLAALTLDADNSFDELRDLYKQDDRLRVPPAVFNALTNEPQTIHV